MRKVFSIMAIAILLIAVASCKKNVDIDYSDIVGKWKCSAANTTSTSSADTLSLFRLVGSDITFDADGGVLTEGGPEDMGMNGVQGSYFIKNNVLYITGGNNAVYMVIKMLEGRDFVTEMSRNGNKLTFEFKRQ